MGYCCFLVLVVSILSATVSAFNYCDQFPKEIVAFDFYKTHVTRYYLKNSGDFGQPLHPIDHERPRVTTGDRKCIVTFQASCSRGETVRIRVTDVNLPDRNMNGNCTDDKIEFHDGAVNPIFPSKLETVCGTEPPSHVIESTNCRLFMIVQIGLNSSTKVRELILEYKSVTHSDNTRTSTSNFLPLYIAVPIGSVAIVIAILIILRMYCRTCRRRSVPRTAMTTMVPWKALQSTQVEMPSAPPPYHTAIDPAHQSACLTIQPPTYEAVMTKANWI